MGNLLDRIALTGVRRPHAHPPTAEDGLYTELWLAAAKAVGVPAEAMGHGFVRVADTWVWRHETDLDGVATCRLAADKSAAHALLEAAGLTVPEHEVFRADEVSPALDFLEHCGRCVVKPARGTARGDGVTTGVTTPADLDRAVLVAARFDRTLLIEAHIVGDVHRVLVLDGRVLDDVVRESPHLVGDGHSSVRQLVAVENQRRADDESGDGTGPLTIDLDMLLTVHHEGLDLRDTPAAGASFTAKAVVNENAAGENRRCLPVKPEIARVAETAATAVGLRLAGVDLVEGDDGVITVLEVNGTPGLLVHERARGPRPEPPLAEQVVRALVGGAG
jgi:D-alanine-D-alanine ligase-like ATP-grasp enzyme